VSNHVFPSGVLVPPSAAVRTAGHPFLTFCVDDYLPTEVDEKLSATFPDDLIMSREGEGFAEYLSLSDGSSLARTFLQRNPIWADYVAAWCSKQNLQHCLTVFQAEFSKRYAPMWRWILKRRLQKLSNLQVSVSLAAYTRGFYLPPHSDDKYKVLTVIHYLPTNDSTPEPRGGTTFYFPREGTTRADIRQFTEWSHGVRRFFPIWMIAILSPDLFRVSDLTAFRSCFQQSFHSEYRRNRICGFVKNDWSMHQVDLRDYPTGEVRRSVLINVWVKKPAIVNFITKIEKRLSTAKQAIKLQKLVPF